MKQRTIGKNLIQLREQVAGITQADLAERSGLKQPEVSKYETERSIPTVRKVLRLAVGLQMAADELLAGLDAEYDELRARLRAESAHESSTRAETPQGQTHETHANNTFDDGATPAESDRQIRIPTIGEPPADAPPATRLPESQFQRLVDTLTEEVRRAVTPRAPAEPGKARRKKPGSAQSHRGHRGPRSGGAR